MFRSAASHQSPVSRRIATEADGSRYIARLMPAFKGFPCHGCRACVRWHPTFVRGAASHSRPCAILTDRAVTASSGSVKSMFTMDMGAPPATDSSWAKAISHAPPWAESPVFEVLSPKQQMGPVVFASPHSGADYPQSFIDSSRLDPLALRKSEDSFVDELFAAAPDMGAPLLRARFPRAFIDVNREPFELDPQMFADQLPPYVNTRSPRVAAGLGTIARVVCSGGEIYNCKLHFDEALGRVNTFYRPYHAALNRLVERTRRQFGHCLLIDCHSMPSVAGPTDSDRGHRRVDIVLGDCYGASCDRRLSDLVRRSLCARGYMVRRNVPYAGAFTTRNYGAPQLHVHALQIEINRALYMNEDTFKKTPGFTKLAEDLEILIAGLIQSRGAAM